MLKPTLHLLLAGSILSAASCSGGGSSAAEKNLLADTTGAPPVKVNREVLDEMIQTLPQPIEIAGIITQSDMPFSKEMLVPSDNASMYADMYNQSLAFGAYGVDLGYINLNGRTIYAIDYLESIQSLAEDIKVDQFFDFATLAELARNKSDADSLVQISTRNFNKIDNFLREQNRGELSVLILIGAWIEGMHVFGQINQAKPSADIQKRIGEQKVVFDNISAIMEKLTQISYFKKMQTDFAPLKAAYDGVSISYEYRQPEMKEVNGELVVVDKSETIVKASPETVAAIVAQIESIRTSYILNPIK